MHEAAVAREEVRGMTISCQTWGHEWGTRGFEEMLVELRALGANWVAIHPYARIEPDGSVRWRAFDPERPPAWLAGPVRAARTSGLGLMIKPHLAYWGSPFGWRGEIDFEEPAARARFWETYRAWIVAVARATAEADAFVVGTELDRLLDDEELWRGLVADVREVTDAHLTYAANWSDYADVPFWDALDAVGVQAYFPLVDAGSEAAASVDEATLRRGWRGVLAELRALHERTGKPVVFTELGYDVSLRAASEPWRDGRTRKEERTAAEALQERCLRVALEVLRREREWLRGAFVWKWFVGEPGRGDHGFTVDHPRLRALLAEGWTRPTGAPRSAAVKDSSTTPRGFLHDF